MDPLVVEFLGVLFRWALTAAGTWLVGHHVLTSDQSETFATAFAHDAVLALPMLSALGLGLWTKYRSRIKFLTGLNARPGSTEADVKATMKSGQGATL